MLRFLRVQSRGDTTIIAGRPNLGERFLAIFCHRYNRRGTVSRVGG